LLGGHAAQGLVEQTGQFGPVLAHPKALAVLCHFDSGIGLEVGDAILRGEEAVHPECADIGVCFARGHSS